MNLSADDLVLQSLYARIARRQRNKRIWRVLEPWLVGALIGAAVGLMFCVAWIHSL